MSDFGYRCGHISLYSRCCSFFHGQNPEPIVSEFVFDIWGEKRPEAQLGRTTQVQISAGTSPIQLLKDARPDLLRSWLRAQRLIPNQQGITEG